MAKMGNYCKAYPVSRFRAFGGWPDTSEQVGQESSENDYMFLQEDFTVTKGVFMDLDVVFDHITPEWIEFCKTDLQFEIPEFAIADVAD